MKYVVFGAGGTGGCIGAFLANAGFDVTLIARGEHLSAIRQNGITVHSKWTRDFNTPVKACTAEEYQGKADIIFVCCKYYSLADAIDFVNHATGKTTVVIPILNVFGTGELMQEKCPGTTVLDGCIYIMAMIEKPGVILQPAPIFRVIFGYRKGQKKEAEEKVLQTAAELTQSKIDAFYSDHILKEELKKFSFVSPMGACCLYMNARGKDLKKPGPVQDLFLALVKEVIELGKAMGIVLEENLLTENTKLMMGLGDDATTSMQRDVLSGRQSEIDGLIHRVVRLSKQYGISLPEYEKISAWAENKAEALL